MNIKKNNTLIEEDIVYNIKLNKYVSALKKFMK